MKPQTFRSLMLFCAIVAILILVTIAFFVITKPKNCPVPPKCRPIQMLPMENVSSRIPDTTDTRDKRVISDQLYPPLNRTDEQNHIAISRSLNNRVNQDQDSFRLVGYLTNNDEYSKDAGGNNWKLFARMKDRHQGEFYIIPTNNNIDLKIPLTNDVVIGEKLRDVYSIPNELKFNSPMLNQTSYKFTEIPKADFSSVRYV